MLKNYPPALNDLQKAKMYSDNANDLDLYITDLKKQIIRERESRMADSGFELSKAKQSKMVSRMSMNSLRQQ